MLIFAASQQCNAKNMSLNTFVYIRDVHNLSDARYCAGMGVDMIGFRLDTAAENYLDASKFREITDWISGVKIVGEFGNLASSQIKEIVADYKLDYLFLHSLSKLKELKILNIPMILSVDLDKDGEEIITWLNFSAGDFAYLLLLSADDSITDSHKNTIAQLSGQHPVLLGFGIDRYNPGEHVTTLGLEGISMAGSPEIRPGFKDYDELADILEALEMD